MATRTKLSVIAPLGVLMILVFGGITLPASASCAAPSIDVTPKRMPSGGRVTITGRYWVVGCNDTNVGCIRPSPDPYRAIRVSISPAAGGPAAPIGQIDSADGTFGFDLTVALIQPPGTYVIEARAADPRSSPARTTIRIVP